jgi:hypothetical protein
MGRIGGIEELQNLATFLLSDGCPWLTGETIAMDGGQHRATGGNFYDLRHGTDAQWQAARATIKAQDQKDRAQRERQGRGAGPQPAANAANGRRGGVLSVTASTPRHAIGAGKCDDSRAARLPDGVRYTW